MIIKTLGYITRSITVFLLPKSGLYFLGMVIVRAIRSIKKLTFSRSDMRDEQIVTVFQGVKMKVDRLSYMGGSLFWTGFHHINEILFLNTYLREDMVFVDIGANQGEFAIFAASLLKNGEVLAFEPVTTTRNLLETNRDLNDMTNLKVYPYGLGNEEALMAVYAPSNDEVHLGRNDGLFSLYRTEFRDAFEEEIRIMVFDDQFLDKLLRLDFIKIDIEGGELYALQGMQKSILKFKPWILIEVGEDTIKAAGYTTADLMQFFDNLDYGFYALKRGELSNKKVTHFDQWGNYIVKPNLK